MRRLPSNPGGGFSTLFHQRRNNNAARTEKEKEEEEENAGSRSPLERRFSKRCRCPSADPEASLTVITVNYARLSGEFILNYHGGSSLLTFVPPSSFVILINHRDTFGRRVRSRRTNPCPCSLPASQSLSLSLSFSLSLFPRAVIMQMRIHLIKEGISAQARNRAERLERAREYKSEQANGREGRERARLPLSRARCYLYSDRFPIIRTSERANERRNERPNENHGGNGGKEGERA